MATIIDQLVVLFSLDAKDFQKGAKDTGDALDATKKKTDSVARDIEESGKRAAQFFTEMRNQALLAASVITGGIGLKEFVEGTVRADAATGRLSTNLHLGVQELSSWEQAAKYAGGSAEGIDSAFRGITKSIESFQLLGIPDNVVQMLNNLHIPIETGRVVNGVKELRSAIDIFKDVSDKIHAHDPVALALGGMLGFDEGTTNFAKLGGAGMQALVDRQRELFTITQQDADAAIALANAWNMATDKSKALGTSILTDLTPALIKFLDVTSSLIGGQSGKGGGLRAFRDEVDILFGIDVDKAIADFKNNVLPDALKGSAFDPALHGGATPSSPAGAPPILWNGLMDQSGGFRTDKLSWGDKMGILLDQFGSTTSPEDRSALLREVAAQGGSLGAPQTSTEINIGHQTINTAATDAHGIARDWHDATFDAAAQANSGIKP